ncbi:bacterioferritin-associated ferredoxin [Pseudooceanicola sp.]|uniref:bacterioferritin-associated ferredoxin n=1 Tax=Pseudooceanicola sp. TaxID=1914328 RepID=UPI0035C67988
MIVCHCNSISDRDIHAAIDWMRASDPDTIITPGKVYHALGKKPDCGGCLDHFIGTMEKSDNLGVPAVLANMRRGRGRFSVK